MSQDQLIRSKLLVSFFKINMLAIFVLCLLELILKMWSPAWKHKHYLGHYYKYKFSGSTPDLQIQKPEGKPNNLYSFTSLSSNSGAC